MSSAAAGSKADTSIHRSLWLARFFWPSLVCVLVLVPAAWYGMPYLMQGGFLRILGIIIVPVLAFFITTISLGFCVGLISRRLSGVLADSEDEKLAEAIPVFGGLLEGELSIEVTEQEGLPLLFLETSLLSLMVSPHSLRELSAEHIGMLLYAQAAGGRAQAPWLSSRLVSLASLLALAPPYTVHFTSIPEAQQAPLLLSSAALMLGALLLASLNLARWREGEGDRLAAGHFGREDYSDALKAWAEHLRESGGGNSGFRRLARLSQQR